MLQQILKGFFYKIWQKEYLTASIAMSDKHEQSQAGASGSGVKEGSTCTIENGALCSPSELAAKYHK